ncbi:efflux transporter outer membrane subunit [Rhizorhabdus histidinilytica]|uniref:efflux transporter outer membrane subunit n=1 Tax=Rhizorhabdus histidinilytica TaxID=439228 RepID=UPI001F167B53|nr:efflux transporter outer membrane subunit [Rhizorhabdus histidinilytica]
MMVAGLGGCAIAPDLGVRPEPAQPSAFASDRSLAGTSHNWPTDSWWQDLGDRQLDALVNEALDNSPTIEQAAARIQMGIAQAERARAALMPSVDATATARYSRITQSIGLPTDGDWHWLMAGLVNLNYDLDLWGKNRAALRAAVSERAASEADAATARITLAAAVSTTYVDFAQLLERRRDAADAARVRRETRDLVVRRFNAGLEARTSMEQAEGSVETAEAQLAAIDEAIGLNRNALAALIGAGPDRGLSITAPSLTSRRSTALPANIPIELVGRNPEVVSARWRVEAAAERIGVARAGFYPNVNIAGLIGLASFGLNNLVDTRSIIGAVGPAISLPIFDGGRLSANYRGARGEYDAAVASYNEELLQALHRAADAATSLRALGPRVQRTDAALARQEAAYCLARMRYEGGLSGYQAVLIVEDALLAAREQSTSLRLRGFVLDIALAKALGGGFRAPAPTANSNS